jgi:hypothetical protein
MQRDAEMSTTEGHYRYADGTYCRAEEYNVQCVHQIRSDIALIRRGKLPCPANMGRHLDQVGKIILAAE